MREKNQNSDLELTERVININRTAKVVKGGRRFSFSALVVGGDGRGKVGIGWEKPKGVPEATRKAGDQPRRSLISVSIIKGTLPHEILGRFGAARVLLKPRSEERR